MNQHLPKNIIFMISDGMGVSLSSAYREYKSQRVDGYHDKVIFNDYLVGQHSTNSFDDRETITDSGASSTAMACGEKTQNGFIGLDRDKNRLTSSLELAKAAGKRTGLCVTAPVTHATPAGFAAHVDDRMNEALIADQYLDDRIDGQIKLDLIMGGGRQFFERADRRLTEEFKAEGFNVVHTFKDLQASEADLNLALFAQYGLPYALDRDYRTLPTLKEMLEESIRLLDGSDDGFFLVVEGSQIDWAAHENDIVAALGEIEDYAEALTYALDFAKEDGDTLVLSTSDHATGGMTMGNEGVAVWHPEYIQGVIFSPAFIARDLVLRRDLDDTLGAMVHYDLTPGEYDELYAALNNRHKTPQEIEKDLSHEIREMVNRRSNTGWTTTNHTGEDVNIYAYGPGADFFRGWRENTDTGRIVKALASGNLDLIP